MDIAGIREAMHRQPFEPFALRVPVPHPDFIAVGGGGRRVVVIGQDDSTTHIEPVLVVSINYPSRAGAR